MAKVQSSILDPKILVPAIGASFKKLDPRAMMKNPVMFVVEVVAAMTTVLFIRDLVTGGANTAFTGQIILWLWFTVVFANLAEAVAEGRGKAQAEEPHPEGAAGMEQRQPHTPDTGFASRTRS